MKTALAAPASPSEGFLALSEPVAAAVYHAGLQLAPQREKDRREPATTQRLEQVR